MKKIHYSWIICLSCMWLCLCNMGLCSNILTVYLPYIEAGGLSAGMGSAILSVRCLFSFLTTFFVGIYYRKLSLRTGALLACLTGAAAALVFSGGSTPFFCYAGAALAGIAYGAGSIYPSSLLLNNWFHTHKGLAIGISSAGSGAATMTFAPIISSIVSRHSLRAAFLFQSAFMIVSALIIFLLIRNTPEEKGLLPFGIKPEKAKGIRQIVSRPLPGHALSLLAFMMLMIGGAGLSFSGHLSVLMVSCGYSHAAAASGVSIFGMVLMIGKFSSGAINDRIGARRSAILLFGIFILGCFSVFCLDGVHAIWCFILPVLVGFGSSIFNVGPTLWASDLTSEDYFAELFRHLQLFYNLGGIIFTILPGIIADHTGEYRSSYVMFAAMLIIALVILLGAYRKYYIPEDHPAG